jgi:hypothetical protein
MLQITRKTHFDPKIRLFQAADTVFKSEISVIEENSIVIELPGVVSSKYSINVQSSKVSFKIQ